MGTYESVVTSCSIIACGKIGAKASGPTGSMVAGFRGGSSWKGRSGTRLYQLSGMAFSSRRYFVCSIWVSGSSNCQRSAVSLQPFAAAGFLLAGCGSSMHPQPALLSCSSETVTSGDFDQEFVVVADDPVDAEVDEPLHRRRVIDGVRYDLERPPPRCRSPREPAPRQGRPIAPSSPTRDPPSRSSLCSTNAAARKDR